MISAAFLLCFLVSFRCSEWNCPTRGHGLCKRLHRHHHRHHHLRHLRRWNRCHGNYRLPNRNRRDGAKFASWSTFRLLPASTRQQVLLMDAFSRAEANVFACHRSTHRQTKKYLHRVDGDGKSGIIPGHFSVGCRLVLLGAAPSGTNANHSQTNHQEQETGAYHYDDRHRVAWIHQSIKQKELNIYKYRCRNFIVLNHKENQNSSKKTENVLAPLDRWPCTVPPMPI